MCHWHWWNYIEAAKTDMVTPGYGDSCCDWNGWDHYSCSKMSTSQLLLQLASTRFSLVQFLASNHNENTSKWYSFILVVMATCLCLYTTGTMNLYRTRHTLGLQQPTKSLTTSEKQVWVVALFISGLRMTSSSKNCAKINRRTCVKYFESESDTFQYSSSQTKPYKCVQLMIH